MPLLDLAILPNRRGFEYLPGYTWGIVKCEGHEAVEVVQLPTSLHLGLRQMFLQLGILQVKSNNICPASPSGANGEPDHSAFCKALQIIYADGQACPEPVRGCLPRVALKNDFCISAWFL